MANVYKTFDLKDEELMEQIEDQDPVEKEDWRHGHRNAYIVESEGANWKIWIDVHHSEGWQTDYPVQGVKVEPKEVLIVKWVPVSQ